MKYFEFELNGITDQTTFLPSSPCHTAEDCDAEHEPPPTSSAPPPFPNPHTHLPLPHHRQRRQVTQDIYIDVVALADYGVYKT